MQKIFDVCELLYSLEFTLGGIYHTYIRASLYSKCAPVITCEP